MHSSDTDFSVRIKDRLQNIYTENDEESIGDKLVDLAKRYRQEVKPNQKWSEKDVILITYGDSIKKQDELPLITLNNFLKKFLKEQLSVVHILPFFPYSSDDGFSVIDFRKVNPELGTWKEITKLSENFDLMFDLVINHASSKSEWFQNFLNQAGKGKDFFITENPKTNLSKVVRPRSSPLLTPYQTSHGLKHVWTTFSADQVDLNFANPKLLLEMVDILLQYISKGARIIRLDAIAFLWKKAGTTCLHLNETHEVVKLLREIAEFVNPSVIILTETNVPNKENLSYFGAGDEAHMVYQFSLPPLLLHALHTGNSTYLTEWAEKLPAPPEGCTFFNFTASHDGIGLRPLEGLIPDDETNQLALKMKDFGGLVNCRSKEDGSQSPYELNITYFDALKGTQSGTDDLQPERFIASQTIMMSFKGVPAFYIHSLTATPNYHDGVAKTGQNRTINRRKWNWEELTELLDNNTHHNEVFGTLKKLINLRKAQTAFHPDAEQRIIQLGNAFFALLRISTDSTQQILCITNLTDKKQSFRLSKELERFDFDLIQNKKIKNTNLAPYQSFWLVES